MRVVFRLLTVALVGGSTLIGGGAVALADPAPPSAVENMDYPLADSIFSTYGIQVRKGDGHILFAPDCAAQPDVIRVWSRIRDTEFCFRTTLSRSGRLTLELPQTYAIRANSYSLTAVATVDGHPQTVTANPNEWRGIGEGADPDSGPATLLEIRTTNPNPPNTPSDPAYSFIAKVDVGDVRGCTGALIAPQWIVTAAACFAEPGQPLAAGPPAQPSNVTIGRTVLSGTAGQVRSVVELVPRADRDVVLAKLATPLTGVVPLPLASTAPGAAEVLRIAGFGRTATEWAPDQLHATQYTVASVTGAAVGITAAADGTDPCPGDAGGPALREANGQFQVVAIGSTSWQHGCLGVTTTQQGAVATRVDDIADWIRQNTPTDATQLILDSQGQVHAKQGIGLFNWTRESDPGVTAIATNGDVHMILDGQGQVWAKQGIGLYNWTLETSPTVKAIAVSSNGTQMILDNQGQVHAKQGIGLFNWTRESDAGVTAIATNGDTQLILNSQGEVWAKQGISLYNWTLETSPTVKAIAVSTNGTQMILDNQGQAHAKQGIGLFNWTLESSPTVKAIAVNGDVQVILDNQNQVSAKQGIGLFNWTLESSPTVTAIAVSPDGTQMILDSQGQVSAKRGVGLFNWTLESSPGVKAIAIG